MEQPFRVKVNLHWIDVEATIAFRSGRSLLALAACLTLIALLAQVRLSNPESLYADEGANYYARYLIIQDQGAVLITTTTCSFHAVLVVEQLWPFHYGDTLYISACGTKPRIEIRRGPPEHRRRDGSRLNFPR
jgi:hypothetical protein